MKRALVNPPHSRAGIKRPVAVLKRATKEAGIPLYGPGDSIKRWTGYRLFSGYNTADRSVTLAMRFHMR